MTKIAQLWLIEKQRELIERLKANGAGDDAILAAQNQLIEIEMKVNRSEAGLLAALPPIPAHPLKARREKVRDLVLSGNCTEDEIAKEIKWDKNTVHNDKAWLRKRGFYPNLPPNYPASRAILIPR